jgi:hypothetical protein
MLAGGSATVTPWLPRGYRGGQAYIYFGRGDEPFVIDMPDPATCRQDWGGPHLAGVLAVHCGPCVVAAALMVWVIVRRRHATA